MKNNFLKFFFTFILIAIVSCHQNKEEDRLSKYVSVNKVSLKPTAKFEIANSDSLLYFSYPLFTYFNTLCNGGGTCFFYKSHYGYTIISNYHVISGIDYENKITPIDNLVLSYKTFNGSKKNMILPIGEINKNYKTGINLKTELDIFGIGLAKIPDDGSINFINDLIDTSYFDKIPDEIFCFGYPGETYQYNPENVFKSKPYLTQCKYISSEKYIKELSKKGTQTILDQKKYFFLSKTSLKGMSGSPVFGKFIIYKDSFKQPVYKFIGIYCANANLLHMGVVIKAKYALEIMDK